ncbi:MAG: SDR family oxidoreductase [Bacteroidales bacterium]|nr:SDR family oxidoreductase [Bacteroidales bacterium]MDT8432477.1 SDR family oxidoreductase [Bacteroidales bacterium]
MNNLNDLKDKVCVITGGGGVIGASLATGLAGVGIVTVILDINEEAAQKVATTVQEETGTKSFGMKANVLDKASLVAVLQQITDEAGQIDFLINGAGGNSPQATTQLEELTEDDLDNLEKSFFGLEMEGFQKVFDLNFMGTLLPTMVFAKQMVQRQKGVILNISSMNAYKPLTKIPAYSAAKASINNFTEWLAVHFAKTGVRVNAIAPGFFLTNQNRFLLLDEATGALTSRGKKIIASTPMGAFGEPADITGTALYLLSDMSHFITGICIPVDGGYSAYGGV